MVGQAASLAFSQISVKVIEAGPELGGPSSQALTDLEARLAEEQRLTHIIYCGAEIDPDRCEREPDVPRWQSAALPPLLAAMAARLNARFIALGTHYVFSGTLTSRGYAESRTCRPVNVLGACQLEGERALLAANPESRILRTGWLYGDEEFGPFARFISELIRASQQGTGLAVVNDEVASPTWVRNLADAILGLTLCDKGQYSLFSREKTPFMPLPAGIYHYVDGGKVSWTGFAAECARLAWKYHHIERPVTVFEVPPESRPGRAARPPCCHLASAKIRKSYPFPSHTWQEYLESFFADSTCSHLFFRLHAQLRSQSA